MTPYFSFVLTESLFLKFQLTPILTFYYIYGFQVMHDYVGLYFIAPIDYCVE